MINVNVYVRGNSIWCSFSIQGVPYRKPFKIKNNKNNYRLALNRASELEEMLDNNIIPSDDDIIIKSVLRQPVTIEKDVVFSLDYYINTFIENGRFSKKNKQMYNAAYNKLKEVIDTKVISVQDVNSIHYGTYKEHLLENLEYNSARTYIGYISIIFNKAINDGIYKGKNPFIRLKRKEEKYIVTITDEHFELILNELKKENLELYRFVYVMKYTGFRLKELLDLRWEDIKWNENLISIITQKDNNRPDLFPLNIDNGILKEFLSSFKKDKGVIFNLNYDWVTKPFQKCIAGINEEGKKNDTEWKDLPRYTIHQIRKTAISKWAKKLMPFELKTLARHRDIATTTVYYINMELNDITKKLNNN